MAAGQPAVIRFLSLAFFSFAAFAFTSPGGHRASQAATALKPSAPSIRVWRDGGKVKLRGTLPSEAERSFTLGIARAHFAGLDISDRMSISGTAISSEWMSGVSFALKLLSHMRRGEVALKGHALSISGVPIDAANHAMLKAALVAPLPHALTFGDIVLRQEGDTDYAWVVQATAGGLAMSGAVPSLEAQGVLERLASELFPGFALINAMEIVADGVPARFLQASAQALKLLRLLDTGTVRLTDQTVEVRGAASNGAAATMIDALLGDFPDGYRVENRIAPSSNPNALAGRPLHGDVTGGVGQAAVSRP